MENKVQLATYVENTVQLSVIVFLSDQIPGAVNCILQSVNIIMHVFCVGGSKLENMYRNLQLSVDEISVIN